MFDFSGKGQAKFPWNLHSDTWIFVLTGNNFRVVLVLHFSVSEIKL